MKHVLLYFVSCAVGVWIIVDIHKAETPQQVQNPSIPHQTIQPIEVVYIEESNQAAEPTVEVDTYQLSCLAQNIYHEARGESYQGKIAVANVTMNRVRSKKFPGTVCGVVKQAVHSRWWKKHHDRDVPVRHKCQFSWYCDGKSDAVVLTDHNGNIVKANMSAWIESQELARRALLNELPDITNNSTHYFNPTLADPEWAYHYDQVAQIGNHVFHRM